MGNFFAKLVVGTENDEHNNHDIIKIEVLKSGTNVCPTIYPGRTPNPALKIGTFSPNSGLLESLPIKSCEWLNAFS
jgi:hypothetical protein